VNKVLLDTDIYSEVVKGKDANVTSQAALYYSFWGQYTISIMSVIEVTKGFRKMRQENRIQQFLLNLISMEVLNLDVLCAELAGRMYADLGRAGSSIGAIDPIIAALAIRNDLTFITGNYAHYRRLQSLGYPLLLGNWREPVSP
jgi:tRNA(fMet)-specific endonuclease VapC